MHACALDSHIVTTHTHTHSPPQYLSRKEKAKRAKQQPFTLPAAPFRENDARSISHHLGRSASLFFPRDAASYTIRVLGCSSLYPRYDSVQLQAPESHLDPAEREGPLAKLVLGMSEGAGSAAERALAEGRRGDTSWSGGPSLPVRVDKEKEAQVGP